MHVTPVVLTFNEAPNIGRTLESLRWAERVIVVDSGSTDGTQAIVAGFPNARLHERPFTSHADQWRFAVQDTDIATDLVLALDADMAVTPALVDELRARLTPEHAGAIVRFEFRYEGRRLPGSIYPDQLRVFRRDRVSITQPGHTQVFGIDGPVVRLSSPVIHDDRKALERWVASQLRYVELEAARIARERSPGLKDRLRRLGVLPALVGALAYVRAGGPLSGRLALRYAWERATFEGLLAIRLLTRGRDGPEPADPTDGSGRGA